ncbi:MAG: HAD family hydrolase [Candidatus Latescibacterota bacterium]
MPPLYISDLDGTLLHPNGTLSAYSRDTLNELIADGLHFSIATARSVASIRQLLHGLDLQLPVVNLNGALVSDLQSGHHHAVHALPSEICHKVCDCITETGHTPFVSTTNGQRDRLYYHRADSAGMLWFVDDRQRANDRRLQQIGDICRVFDEQVLTLTVIGHDASIIEELRQILARECPGALQTYIFANSYSDLGDVWLTIADARATKDQGIRLLAEHCGLSLDELTVFGDNDNDVEMFRMAPHAIAVANAIDSVLDVATETIGSNSEDSVAQYLQKREIP